MKITRQRNRERGLMLVETLVYIAVLAVFFTTGFGAFYQMQLRSLRLQRSAADIARALHAGEQWRKEMREAKTAQLSPDGSGMVLELPAGRVTYAFETNSVVRQSHSGARTRVLPGVRASAMRVERRAFTEVWSWDVELSSAEKDSRLKPMFTFLAARRNQP